MFNTIEVGSQWEVLQNIIPSGIAELVLCDIPSDKILKSGTDFSHQIEKVLSSRGICAMICPSRRLNTLFSTMEFGNLRYITTFSIVDDLSSEIEWVNRLEIHCGFVVIYGKIIRKGDWTNNLIKIINVDPGIQIASALIENLTKQGDLVFDPFLTDGTTLVAAKTLSRQFYGIAINEVQKKAIEDRLAKVIPIFLINQKPITDFYQPPLFDVTRIGKEN